MCHLFLTAGGWLDRPESTFLTDCVVADDSPPDGNLAKCYSQPYAYAYLDVPTFVVQSLNDPASYSFCYKPPCGLKGNTPGSCTPPQLKELAWYHNALKGNITHAQAAFGTVSQQASKLPLNKCDSWVDV